VRAVYPGSFDPITNGHLDVVQRGARLFDEVIVSLGVNPSKRYFFTQEERLAMMRDATAGIPNVRITSFQGLLIEHVQAMGARVILRGLRVLTDFEHEFQLGLANRHMAPYIDTVFVLTEPENIFISSSLVKEIALSGGDFSAYVPPAVMRVFQARAAKP
jgi:pantetheine-phosphate adenylyltransferase